MPPPVSLTWITLLLLGLAPVPLAATRKAEILESRIIWMQAKGIDATDVLRLQDRWILAYRESSQSHVDDGAFRILGSTDGITWQPIALLHSPTPKRGLSRPRLTLTPQGQVLLTGQGIVANPKLKEPLPKYGGTVQSMAWGFRDGRTWSDAENVGRENYLFSRIVWHKQKAYSYARGCICGNSQTVQIGTSTNGRNCVPLYEETFSGFFPDEAALQFRDDVAICLMSRVSARENKCLPGYLGTARTPFDTWTWKPVNAPITTPNIVRFTNNQLLVTVGLTDRKSQTSLCHIDVLTGELTEILQLPLEGKALEVGVAVHDGQLWVTYADAKDGKARIHLTRLRLP